eukprot:gene2634-3831_t
MQKNNYTHYRNSNIGISLEDSITELVEGGKISSNLSKNILEQFDRSVSDGLLNSKNKMSFKGHCHTYRYAENVYVFLLQDVQFKTDKNQTIDLDSVKIVACDGTKTEKKKKK